ncbi:uncharacterized protein [Argopecten irradians]|uniref:uncharacterized protein isoform X2 n=1 Tax=Argopecten irradians TaxID=31199 RepID=UPI0037140437
MACAPTSGLLLRSRTGSSGNKWIADIVLKLGRDFTQFASQIGFTETQVQHLEHAGEHVYRLVIDKWLYTIGRHTTKYVYVIYTALLNLNRNDLLIEYFKSGPPDKYSVDIWDDFIEELHTVNIANLESEGKGNKSEVKKNEKKKNKQSKHKRDSGLEKTERDDEKDTAILELKDDLASSRTPCEDKPVIIKKMKKNKQKAKDKNDDGIAKETDGDTETETLGGSKKSSNPQELHQFTAPKENTEPDEKDTAILELKDDLASPETPCEDEVKEATRRTDRKTEAVHYHFNEPAMIGDNNIMSIQTSQSSPSGGLDSEKIRDQLHEIMVGQGAVGGNERMNTMSLQTLEACFHRRYSKSFKSDNGIQMLDFLKQAADYFVITMMGSQYFVHMRTPKTSSQIHETNESSVQSNIISSKRETKQCSKHATDSASADRPVYVQKQKGYIPNKCSEFEDFLNYVNHFSGDNLLLISKTNFIKHIDTLANIKWICVFDFDPSSRKDGLFFKIEDIVKKNFGSLHPRTWNEPPNITNSGTEWCFISGLKEDPESQTPDEFKKWYPKIKQKFEKHVEQINSLLDTLSILTVVAFWPEDRVTGMKFQKIISVLEESISPAPKVVVIGTPSAEHDTFLDKVSPDRFLKEKLEHVFHDLSINVEPQQSSEDFRYMLPTDDGINNAQIDSSLANSLRENMHVLYLDNPYQSSVSDMSASEVEEQHFFKGGTLSWQSYYANGPEYFYSSRDLLRTIVDDIKREFVDRLNPGIVKIMHAPGAGGTTLGQNIIWELHNITPCIQIRTDAAAKPRDIAANISALGKNTHSPVVALSDGIEDDQLDLIQQQLHNTIVIFIHLKRTSDNKITPLKNEYFLEGHLSPKEACSIGPRFIRCCRDDVKKKDQIQRLVDDVRKGVKHHLIEFGLVIHLEEFNGLASYVAEYLKIDKQSKGFSKSQRVLGYLSLVQFFGQGILPCQMLGTMLGKSDDYKLTYGKFPRDIQEFTVPVGSASNQHSIRICHFLVARQILDQLLSGNPSKEMGCDLSESAKSRLQPFVLEFIDDLKTRQEKIGQMSKHVLDIIIQTFIYREFSSNQNQQRKRKFSKLIESIPAQPPFTECLKVLEKLAESFPESPSLWAHLGRAYSLLCPVQLDKTETFFQKAIDGCQKEESQTDTDYDDPDVVLSYVLHMYGMFYLRRIQGEIDMCRGQQDSEMEFQKAAENILNLADIACTAFTKCRRCGVAGESYGCNGEIKVRLCICEFLKGHYHFSSIDDLIEKSKNTLIFSFVERSVSKIQHLFITCFTIIDQADLANEVRQSLTRYQSLFKEMIIPWLFNTVTIRDSFEARCAKLTGI